MSGVVLAGRSQSVDFIRGLCLVTIFINHIRLGFLNEFSLSNIGFSDAAEIFVFLSGFSVFNAYGRLDRRALLMALSRRFGSLFCWNVLLVVSTLAILVLFDQLNGEADAFYDRLMHAVYRTAFERTALDILTFRQTIGYSNVLRLYLVLIFWTPVLIWLASRRWWLPLPLALAIWAAAGHFDLVLRNSLTGDPFMLAPLPWLLVFTCGLALAAAIESGVRLAPSRLLAALALAYLLSYVVLVCVVAPHSRAVVDWLVSRNDFFWFGASKTYQSPLRVLHLLALAYIVVVHREAPLVRLLHQADRSHVLCRLGRRSLPVFVFGAVAAMLGDEVLYALYLAFGAFSVPAVVFEIGFVGAGIAVMVAIADRRWRLSRPAAQARSDVAAATPA